MQVLYSQVSGLVGLFVFIAQMWNLSPAERAIFTACVAGLAVYVLFICTDLVVRRTLVHTPQQSEEAPPAAAPERAERRELATA